MIPKKVSGSCLRLDSPCCSVSVLYLIYQLWKEKHKKGTQLNILSKSCEKVFYPICDLTKRPYLSCHPAQ